MKHHTTLLLPFIFLLAFGPAYAEEKQLPPERHPVLIFEEKDVPTLRERVKREPYLTWWNGILASSDGALKDDAIDAITYEPQKCKLAKSLAFAYVITGKEEYAAKCLEIFHKVKLREDGGDWSVKYLPEHEGAADLAQAYDMIHNWLAKQSRDRVGGSSSCRPNGEGEAPAEPQPNHDGKEVTNTEKKGDGPDSSPQPHPPESELRNPDSELDFVRRFLYRFGLYLKNRGEGWYVFHFNNHQTRHYSGLAIVAFALADARYGEPYPSQWYYGFAKEWVERAYKYQTTTDGAWAEGHNYFAYSAGLHLPYFFAARNSLGVDYFAEEHVRLTHDWSVLSRMPNGLRPNFDDAALSAYPTHFLTSAYKDAGLYRWDWNNLASKNWAGGSPVDAICWFDDSVKPAPPAKGPCLFFDEGGDAIFRSDWSKDAVYLNARAEHGKARKNGGGHEHPDETSFTLFACGQPLAIDGGYIYWEKRTKVYTADNHNLILVDGKGPRTSEFDAATKQVGGDAFLKNPLVKDRVACCEIHAAYCGVSVKRCIIFVDSRFFIILDEIASPVEHTYKWLLHGNGGGDTGGKFAMTDTGARWEIGDAALQAFVFSTAPSVKYKHKKDDHSFNYGEEKKHEALIAEAKGANVMFVSVLMPGKQAETCPKVNFERGDGAFSLAVDGAVPCRFELRQSGDFVLSLFSAASKAEQVLARTGGDTR
ncbi:MAG: heparinase II/III family protein [Planctomycetota bacterium]|nr:heparinase II/III family protein [Planctomycetota bacterium]